MDVYTNGKRNFDEEESYDSSREVRGMKRSNESILENGKEEILRINKRQKSTQEDANDEDVEDNIPPSSEISEDGRH